ncbi:transmembrane 7 superfamily member 3-like [Xenopus laevis]|uniref:Transmembrane 7 superfamily member 3-like n=1 Tax=Xenopus laevis TaxID=8355 RepID=A0A8J1MJR5_XENLA|nr:transmembrane 7 superfamily member 3-like [Xenopus laevis]
MRPPDSLKLLLCLCVYGWRDLSVSSAGLLEVSIGQFTDLRLNHTAPTEILLRNIPVNVSFVLFHVHTLYQNVTVSLSKIPTANDSETGSDAGLLNELRPVQTNCSWYLASSDLNQLLATAVTVPYGEKDPVPGACNVEFSLDVDPNVYLRYNLYETVITFAPANLGSARGNNAPPCDIKREQETRWRLLYDIYQYFLPENNLSDTVLLAHLHRMSMVQAIMSNGIKLLTLNSEQMTKVSFSSIPGQGVIYNVIVRDPLLNTSAAYVPVHTYACNFTNVMDNCYTLGKASTRVFFTFCALFGLFICFFGHQFLKTEFFFMGFIIVGFLIFILLTRVTVMGYDGLLGVTSASGIIGGLLFVGFWWRFGCPHVCLLLVGLVLGFLTASIVFFTPIGDYGTFHDDTVFWLTFACISLVVPVAFLVSAKTLNIFTCSVVGSYTLVLAVDSYVFTSLTYITLNIVKRAVNQEFSSVYTSVPFQTNDFIMIALWVVLYVSGVATQLYREREKTPFPPTPYLLWIRDRERRKTNVLDPSYHLPPLRERILIRLAQFRDFFRRDQPTGERSPLLL